MNALLTGLLAANSQQQSGLPSLLILVVLIGGGYAMVAPQRKQRKQQAEMLSKLKVGDEVVTSGGILGFVTFLEDDVAHVQVDTDVVIRVNKSSITRRPGANDDGDDETADVTDDATGDAAGDDAVTDEPTTGGWRARVKGASKPTAS